MIWLIVIVTVYVLLCVAFFFGQHFFFFRPEMLPSTFEYEYEFPVRERTFQMDDGGVVNAIHFEVPNERGVVFYLKGNSRSIKGWGKFAKDFLGKGYDFFMMDYRGFGKSSGKRTEQTLYSDALELFDILTGEYASEDIVVYGRSFGSGVAAYVASKRKPKLLILDSPYYTFKYQISRFIGWMPLAYLLKYQIPTIKYVQASNCPVHIMHGERDYIISYKQGVMLAKQSGAELITIEGGRHNNLPEKAQFQEELYRVLSE